MTPTPHCPPRARRHARPVVAVAAVVALIGLGWGSPAEARYCQKAPCPTPDANASEGTAGMARIDRHGVGLPLQQRGRAGGPADAPDLSPAEGGPCGGVIGVLPDHVITLRGDLDDLRLRAQSRAPVALVVHGPTGWVCSGTPGSEATLQGNFGAGTWRVWVASDAPGAYPDYTLHLERNVAGPAPPGRRPGHPDARPTPRGPGASPAVGPTHPGARPERSGERPRRDREPPTPFVFRGRFGELDVRFQGASVDALHAECTAFAARSSGLDWVDSILVHGDAHRKPTGWWSPAALCAMAALNARPEGSERAAARAHGRLEEAPFEVHGTDDDLQAVLTRFLPIAVDMTWADDLEVHGEVRRNRTGYWSIEEVVMLVRALARD